jgi:uncharacterized protein (TIGR02265 family)
MAADAFEEPRYDVDVDVQAYLRECPRGATTRGAFFTSVRDFAHRKLKSLPNELFAGVSRKRWVPFSSYSLAEFMALVVNAAGLVYGDVALGEGLRRLGWISYESFAATMAGRVVLFALGEGLEQVVLAVPKAYALTVPGSQVSVSRRGDRDWLIEMRHVPSFPDCYHAGVLEGAVRAHGFEPDLVLRRQARLSDVDFRVRW